jgi:Flp pilus assembly protein TadG
MQGSKELGVPTKKRGAHQGASAGQALVEMSLILPFVLLLVGIAWTASDAMHNAIGLTSAARAGAIWAASDLTVDGSASGITKARNDATTGVNAEEGVNIYVANTGACTNNCVTLTQTSGATSSINEAQITVTHSVLTNLPLLSGINVSASATARY